MPVYVQHEVLGKVNDVFNAESIWQAPGLALFARRPLLRDLLERSPREQRGRAPTRCFSHITLMLAQDELDDDRHLTRGARVRDLAQSLTALHQKDFGDLLGGDDVRYDVVGTDTLAPGQVEVKFGHAVYLPVPAEAVLYRVDTSPDGAHWDSACTIYPEQRLALLGADADRASEAVAHWPFAGDGAILLVNDGPDAPIEVQVRPKNAFECSFDAASAVYTFQSKHARLLMKVTRIAAPAAKPATVWKTRVPVAQPTAIPLRHDEVVRGSDATLGVMSDPTSDASSDATSDATYAPLAQYKVSLVALALPRLSRYRDTGAAALEIGLDRSLRLCAQGEAAAISFTVDCADQLFATTGSGRRRVLVPSSFNPANAGAIELLPVAPAMAERYCATLRLAHPVEASAGAGARFVFGRSAPMLAALRVLDSARFLQLDDGVEAASADRIGLSRSAFSFELTTSGCQISRLSASQALYHLDAKLDFVASIGAATLAQPYTLPPGHHLVAGHYVLRFDA